MPVLKPNARAARMALGIAVMAVSAYSVFRWRIIMGRISGWTGLPNKETTFKLATLSGNTLQTL